MFLVVGACDWETHGLARRPAARRAPGRLHAVRVRADAARAVRAQEQRLVLRVDDTPHPFKLEGKQGYGNARGIWQTVYLEARPASVRSTPCTSRPTSTRARSTVTAALSEPGAGRTLSLALRFKTRRRCRGVTQPVAAGAREAAFDVPHPEAAPLVAGRSVPLRGRGRAGGRRGDGPRRRTYFGMRKIGVVRPARHGLPLRRAERQARLPPDDARPVLSPGGLLHLPERCLHARRDPALAADRPERHPPPRQDRRAAQALLGRPARAADHGRRAQQLGRAGRRDAAGDRDAPCAA